MKIAKSYLVLGAFVLIVTAVLTGAFYFLGSRPSRPAETANSSHSELTGKTSVSNELLGAKVDFARKIVEIKSASDAASFKREISQSGNQVLSQINPTTFVILLDKSQLADQTEQLQDSSYVKSTDTDYPAAVTADTVDWGVDRINAPKVWQKTTGNTINIAVLDTGVDSSHPDLSGQVSTGFNFVEDNADYTDRHGHGTHVSGIASLGQNGLGYQGASYEAKILAGKVLGDDGVGYLSDVIEGIDWARQTGAQIINLSLGTTYDSKLLEDAVNRAAADGVIVVAAAGNTGGSMLYPAAYSSVLSVGATDRSDTLASFSARGAKVVAPGVSITSSLPGGGYASWSGTSMSAPHVSAAAALLFASGERDVLNRLLTTATDLGSSGVDSEYGNGLINLETAVAGESDTLVPLTTITAPAHQSTVSGTISLAGTATDESGIQEVSFSIDGRAVGKFIAEPYQMSYDTTKVPDGDHTFNMTASDNAGNKAEVKVAFKSSNGSLGTNPSGDVRQDTNNPGQDVRQDKPPVGTNLGQRQGQPPAGAAKGKKSSYNMWYRLPLSLFRAFVLGR